VAVDVGHRAAARADDENIDRDQCFAARFIADPSDNLSGVARECRHGEEHDHKDSAEEKGYHFLHIQVPFTEERPVTASY